MVRSLLPLAAMACGILSAHAAAQSAEVILGRNLAATCAGCHGTDGRSVGGMQPLAGRPRSEIERALREFRDGKRPATVMQQLARGYTDDQIGAVSSYLSAQKSTAQKSTD